MSPFDLLGLPEGADAAQIRQAYASALKRTRPDDDAAAFQRLHEAYQAAMRQARAPALAWDASDEPDAQDEALDDDWNEDADWRPVDLPPPDPATLACVEDICAAATRLWPKPLEAWLGQHKALYSLELKRQLTVPLLRRLLDVVDGLQPRCVDVIVAFFAMDELGTVPYGDQQLVWELQARAHFDYAQFEADLLRQCHADIYPDKLRHWLEGQDLAWTQAGERLHARLATDDSLAINPQLVEVIATQFGYGDRQRLLDRHRALWAIQSGRAWDYEVYTTLYFGGPLRQLCRRWKPWQAVLYETINSDARVIARLGREMSAGFDGLPPGIDPRQFAFFSKLADPRYLGWWRWCVIAGKGLEWLLTCSVISLVIYHRVLVPEVLQVSCLRVLVGVLVTFFRFLASLLAPAGNRKSAEPAVPSDFRVS